MIRLDSRLRGHRATGAAALLAFALALCPLAAPRAAAQEAAPPELEAARQDYEFAEFGPALAKLEPLIAGGGLAGEALRDAHVLKARCLVGLGRLEEAKASYCAALALDEAWTPDRVLFPRDEIDVFDQALVLCPPEPAAAAPEPAPAPAATPGMTPAVTPATPSPRPAPLPVPAPAEQPGKKKKSFFGSPVGLALGGAVLVGIAVAAGGGGGGGGGTPAGPLPAFPPPPGSAR